MVRLYKRVVLEKRDSVKDKYLPLGSVVILKEAEKKLVITGFRMKAVEIPDKIYDYCGCMFPEGTISSELTCVFDHSQIEKVFFTGYEDEEAKEFLDTLKSTYIDEEKQQDVSEDRIEFKFDIIDDEEELERL